MNPDIINIYVRMSVSWSCILSVILEKLFSGVGHKIKKGVRVIPFLKKKTMNAAFTTKKVDPIPPTEEIKKAADTIKEDRKREIDTIKEDGKKDASNIANIESQD